MGDISSKWGSLVLTYALLMLLKINFPIIFFVGIDPCSRTCICFCYADLDCKIPLQILKTNHPGNRKGPLDNVRYIVGWMFRSLTGESTRSFDPTAYFCLRLRELSSFF